MKSNHNGNKKNEIRMELKYCERCGGLWLRESGEGVVYCDNCTACMEELPAPKKARRPALPVRRQAAVEKYDFEVSEERISDLKAAGGVA